MAAYKHSTLHSETSDSAPANGMDEGASLDSVSANHRFPMLACDLLLCCYRKDTSETDAGHAMVASNGCTQLQPSGIET